MSVVGLGIDVVDLARVRDLYERHGERFTARICRPGEVQPRQGAALIEHIGGLFAAKEAVLKALGTGWAQGLSLRQVEVVRGPGGIPTIRLHGAAAERAATLGAARTLLSISHERTFAAAVAVLEANPL